MRGVTSRDVVEFVWDGQEGLFELAERPNRRLRYPKAQALASLSGRRYFAPLARRRDGSKKTDVAITGNVLWADIDSLDGLERIRGLPVEPNLVVFSGRKGYWAYYKLASPIPTDDIETLNVGLEVLLDADHCHNRDRLARLPGSVHEVSGKVAEIVSCRAEARALRLGISLVRRKLLPKLLPVSPDRSRLLAHLRSLKNAICALPDLATDVS